QFWREGVVVPQLLTWVLEVQLGVPQQGVRDLPRSLPSARWPIDAHQLEMGADYRSASGRRKTARKIADALVRYAELYLEHPSEELGDHHPLPPELPEESDE
ncbi:MAG: hypothetical protein ACKOGA_14285, partial [Planctomycetaceae bacterium]